MINDFIKEHNLHKIIEETKEKVKEYFGKDTETKLELSFNPEYETEEDGELFLYIITSMPQEEAEYILDKMDTEWFFHNVIGERGIHNFHTSLHFLK